jgi:solute carrier family 44 (choline transporter-like protein), member 2/4/5
MVSTEQEETICKDNRQQKLIEQFCLAFREGDLDRILIPRDTDGYQCGHDSEVVDKPYLMFFDLAKCADPLVPLNGCPTPQTCVKECPTESFLYNKETCRSDINTYKSKLICSRNVNIRDITSCDQVEKYIEEEKCAEEYLKSTSCKLTHYYD